MINWKKELIDELKSHEARKEAIYNLTERIDLTKNQIYNISACQTAEKVETSHDNSDDIRLSKMVELEKLRIRKVITQKRVKLVQKCLDSLSKEQRLIIEHFYIKRTEGYIAELEEALFLSRTQIYKEKDNALHRLVELMYGIGE